MSILKKIGFTLFILFIAIQFIPSARNENGQMLAEDISRVIFVPPTVQSVLKTSCYDCHSNNTNYPWYSRIQPIRWMQDNHVQEGKENLNFSEFGSYSKRKQRNKLRAIIGTLDENSMPISSYSFMHPNAKLSKSTRLLIKNWAIKNKDTLAN